jgi:hypothetical protein
MSFSDIVGEIVRTVGNVAASAIATRGLGHGGVDSQTRNEILDEVAQAVLSMKTVEIAANARAAAKFPGFIPGDPRLESGE